MILKFDVEKTYKAALEIEDSGNVALRGTTANGMDCYILTQTQAGFTYILKYGPIYTDLSESPFEFDAKPPIIFTVSYKRIPFKEKTLLNELQSFLNMNHLVNAEIITKEDVLSSMPISENFII